jgi:hypothetical protein
VDADEALKTAIKVAVDAGEYERAMKLIEVLKATPPLAAVLSIASRAPRIGESD